MAASRSSRGASSFRATASASGTERSTPLGTKDRAPRTAGPAPLTQPESDGAAAETVLQPGRPVWRAVLVLAWPVLIQQFLVLSVGLSDRFLAGRFDPATPGQRDAAHIAYQS